jgi:hypothetical protein
MCESAEETVVVQLQLWPPRLADGAHSSCMNQAARERSVDDTRLLQMGHTEVVQLLLDEYVVDVDAVALFDSQFHDLSACAGSHHPCLCHGCGQRSSLRASAWWLTSHPSRRLSTRTRPQAIVLASYNIRQRAPPQKRSERSSRSLQLQFASFGMGHKCSLAFGPGQQGA